MAGALPPGYQVQPRIHTTGLPVALRFLPDGRLLFAELQGRIMVVPAGDTLPRVWATLPTVNTGERGLLGLAVHPDFPDSPYVYAFHTNPSPLENRVVRMVDSAGIGTRRVTFFEGIPAGFGQHHGGRLAFGPDRMLYVTHGDQGDAANARDVAELSGKILRLGPGGQAAPGNPFGPFNPVAMYGVRNPFGLCFDPLDGIGYFTENGEDCDDEVDVIQIGGDYGWGPAYVCAQLSPGAIAPVASFTPPIAPTGACLYRGGTYAGYLDGDLLFGTFNAQGLMRVKFVNGSVTQADTIETITALGEAVYDVTVGPQGYIWFSTDNQIRRVAPSWPVGVGGHPAPRAIAAAPNPFRNSVTLALPGWGRGRIEVLDAAGRRVHSWIDPPLGRVVWDGRDESGREMPAGIYFARVSGQGPASARRIVKLGR